MSQRRVEWYLLCVAIVAMAILVGVMDRQFPASQSQAQTVAVPFMPSHRAFAADAVPDYYCVNRKTGDCYEHFPIFGPGCDEGYIATSVPCAVPTPTPTVTPTPTAPPTPTPTPTPSTPYERVGIYTLLSGRNVYSPSVVDLGGELRMYYGGWETDADYPSDKIFLARSFDGATWTKAGPVITVEDLPEGASHANDPSVVHLPDGFLMAFTGAEWSPYPESRDAVWLASSSDGLDWTVTGKLIEDAGEPCLYRVGGDAVWIAWSDRLTYEIRAALLDVQTSSVGASIVLLAPPEGRRYANPHVTQLASERWLLTISDYGDAGGTVTGRLSPSPFAWADAEPWDVFRAGERIPGQVCGWYSASTTVWGQGFRLWAGESYWPSDPAANCLSDGCKNIIEAVYWPPGEPIPTPTPTPTPWVPACPAAPAIEPSGWYWNLEVEVNTGTKLIVLGSLEGGTCYYLKRWTGHTSPAWVRYATQGPWSAQGLYPLPATPVQRYRVEVYVPPAPNLWARIVREVAPPEGGPPALPTITPPNNN